jgi:hypothetical protein
MSWFKVDDGFFMHPKVVAAGNAAIGLWIRCGAYSAHQLTDGFIPRDVAYMLGSRALCIKLVEAGLWKPGLGGWQMHDFHDYQPSGDEVRELRRKRAEAGRKGGLNGKHPDSNQEATSEASASALLGECFTQCLSKTEPRTRPVPVPEVVTLRVLPKNSMPEAS